MRFSKFIVNIMGHLACDRQNYVGGSCYNGRILLTSDSSSLRQKLASMVPPRVPAFCIKRQLDQSKRHLP
jgi:hypothetical protein